MRSWTLALALCVLVSFGTRAAPVARAESGTPPAWLRDKARVDAPDRIPELARGLVTGHGAAILVTGMYWRDVSRYAIDLDDKSLSYDVFVFGKAPRQGHVKLDAARLARVRAAWEAAWRSPRDNAERPDEPLRHGILQMPTFVLVDGPTQRAIGFSTAPLPAVLELLAVARELAP